MTAAEGHSDTMVADMGQWLKQRCVTEFLHEEETASTAIHQSLLSVYGEKTVDVNTVVGGVFQQW